MKDGKTSLKGKGENMAYKFNITRGNAILNFSEEFCQSRCQLIESESFAKVLEKYIKHIKRTDKIVLIICFMNIYMLLKKMMLTY